MRRGLLKMCWTWAVVAVALLTPAVADAQNAAQALALQCDTKTYVHRNIVVLGFPCPAKSDVSIVPTQQGAEKIIQALEVLYAQSPQSFAVIEQLKQAGPVIVIYDPSYPPPGVHLTTTQIALFLPTFIDSFDKNNTGKQFTVIVGRDGIKWPLKELAAVLVHELMGHGKQHLEDRIDTMRTLDVECEAWLHQELAHQDLKLDKQSKDMVDFRQQLEGIHCDDFIRYMRKRTPDQAALWDVQNPDVIKLLTVFDGYIVEQRSKGMIASAQAATERMREEAIQKVARTGNPDELYDVGVMYMTNIGQDPDPKTAATWFRKAAAQGHANAQVELATLLENGTGIEKNLPLAINSTLRPPSKIMSTPFTPLACFLKQAMASNRTLAKPGRSSPKPVLGSTPVPTQRSAFCTAMDWGSHKTIKRPMSCCSKPHALAMGGANTH